MSATHAWRLLLVAGLVLDAAGCSCTPGIAGGEDAGLPQDGGALDAGPTEDGGDDGGQEDAGLADAGLPDAGDPDAGAGDAGADDAGAADAGPGDDDGGTALLDAGLPLTCTSCHGSERNAAPPRDTHGDTARTSRTVGAHQPHLGETSWRRTITCDDCHRVPATLEEPGHIDPSPAELTWGAVPNADNVSSSFNGATCITYCHGVSLGGGTHTTPDWTLDPSVVCTDCHGAPPPPPHPVTPPYVCTGCHPPMATEGHRHIDGHLDLALTCNACHGDATSNAPPRDTRGSTSPTSRGVGAHRSHLGPSSWHAELTCEDCHVVPMRYDDPGHLDALPAELHYGATAQAQGATPTWNGVTCSNYCHGQTLPAGGTNTTPTWTTVDGTQAACGTCHALPPPAPHVQNAQCSTCHGAVLGPDGGFVDPTLHVNGLVEAQVACGSCHALPPATGTHLLHVGTGGSRSYGSLSTAASVTSPTGYAFGCGHCHPIDAAKHLSGGLADVELYSPSAPPGSLKAMSPLATYTRGATVFTDDAGLSFTQGTCSNVYCHSGPSYAAPGPVPRPGVDFSFAGYPVSYPSFPLDVSRSYQPVTWGGTLNGGCGSCHGFPVRTTDPAVRAGAGQSHAWLGPTGLESGHAFNHNGTPLSCRTCHHDTVTALNATGRTGGVSTYGPVPIVGWARHVNGLPDVAFDTTTSVVSGGRPQSLVGASYSQATKTCSNVSCHQSQSAVVNGHPFRPDQVSLECNACHQY